MLIRARGGILGPWSAIGAGYQTQKEIQVIDLETTYCEIKNQYEEKKKVIDKEYAKQLKAALESQAVVFKEVDGLYQKAQEMLIEYRRRAVFDWGFHDTTTTDIEVYEFMIENEWDNFGNRNVDFDIPN